MAKVIDTQTGQIMPENTSTKAIRTIDHISDGIVVTYQFPYIAIDSLMHNGEWHYIFSFENFPESSVPGMPRIPLRNDEFEVPTDCDIDLSYDQEYTNYTYKLMGALSPMQESQQGNPEILPLNYTGFYPSFQEQKVDISDIPAGTYIATLMVNSEVRKTFKFNI